MSCVPAPTALPPRAMKSAGASTMAFLGSDRILPAASRSGATPIATDAALRIIFQPRHQSRIGIQLRGEPIPTQQTREISAGLRPTITRQSAPA